MWVPAFAQATSIQWAIFFDSLSAVAYGLYESLRETMSPSSPFANSATTPGWPCAVSDCSNRHSDKTDQSLVYISFAGGNAVSCAEKRNQDAMGTAWPPLTESI